VAAGESSGRVSAKPRSLWYAESGLPNIDPVLLLLELLVLIVSLSIHEAAHAWSANRLGDNTARLLGRLTINPVAHVDVFGTIVLPVMAMLLPGAPIIGYAKPVPVNTRNLGHDWRQKFMLVAAAGPASNLVIAIVGAAIFRLLGGFENPAFGSRTSLVAIAGRVTDLNVLLAVFNMLPVPMLDGGNVLSGLLKGPVAQLYDSLRPYGFLILYGLLLSGVFAAVVGPIHRFVLDWLL
jgi:Zn-dependent protease